MGYSPRGSKQSNTAEQLTLWLGESNGDAGYIVIQGTLGEYIFENDFVYHFYHLDYYSRMGLLIQKE